jgi:hypothetical protein
MGEVIVRCVEKQESSCYTRIKLKRIKRLRYVKTAEINRNRHRLVIGRCHHFSFRYYVGYD